MIGLSSLSWQSSSRQMCPNVCVSPASSLVSAPLFISPTFINTCRNKRRFIISDDSRVKRGRPGNCWGSSDRQFTQHEPSERNAKRWEWGGCYSSVIKMLLCLEMMIRCTIRALSNQTEKGRSGRRWDIAIPVLWHDEMQADNGRIWPVRVAWRSCQLLPV